MQTRASTVFLLLVILVILGCKNEPYDTGPLAVTEFKNITDNISLTFQYRKSKLYIFQAATQTRKFFFSDALPDSIVSDSTSTSYALTHVTHDGTRLLSDTTWIVSAPLRTTSLVRKYTYGNDGHLSEVEEWTFASTTTAHKLYQLTWTDGNVTQLSIQDVTLQPSTLISRRDIIYDDQHSVYMQDPVYMYTLPLAEYYWLSVNNPVGFSTDSSEEKPYFYWYNKFGYPTNFKNSAGDMFGCTYRGILPLK